MAVTRWGRLPFIGTSVTLGGARVGRWLARGCVDLPLVSFELHGIDWLDVNDGLGDLARHQPDLRVSVDRKQAALAAAIGELRRAGARFVTLADAADELGSARRGPVGASEARELS